MYDRDKLSAIKDITDIISIKKKKKNQNIPYANETLDKTAKREERKNPFTTTTTITQQVRLTLQRKQQHQRKPTQESLTGKGNNENPLMYECW